MGIKIVSELHKCHPITVTFYGLKTSHGAVNINNNIEILQKIKSELPVLGTYL